MSSVDLGLDVKLDCYLNVCLLEIGHRAGPGVHLGLGLNTHFGPWRELELGLRSRH